MRKDPVGDAIACLLRAREYTGFFLTRLRKIQADRIPTIGVNYSDYRISLLYNKDFMASLTEEEAVSVLEHEALHIIFKHVFIMQRELKADTPKVSAPLLNIAFDLSVNSYISFSDKLLTEIHTPQLYGLPPRQPWTWYRDRLLKAMEEVKGEPKASDPQKTPEEQKEAFDKMSPPEKLKEIARGLLRESEIQEALDKRNESSSHEWEVPEGMTEEDEKLIDAILKQELQKAKEDCTRARGRIPGHLSEYLDRLLKKKPIEWNTVLQQLMASVIHQIWKPAYNRTDRRFGTYPGKKRDAKAEVIIVIDTSGSVSNEDLANFFTNIDAIQRVLDVKIVVVQCDAKVHSHKKYVRGMKFEIEGRGGTDFRPAFEYIKKKQMSPNLVVFFTDGYGPAPEKPPRSYLTVWVYPRKYHTKLPWGYHLEMNP